jgi:6-phosphogluconolactonase
VNSVQEIDEPAAASTAAGWIASRLAWLVKQRGHASVAFSGGRTPLSMFDMLCTLSVPWAEVTVFQVDERVAPDDDAARNWTGLRKHLLDPAQVPRSQWRPMPVTHDNLDAAARSYADELHLLADGAVDVVHLGLGEDGHTASWPPGDPVLTSVRDVDIVGPYAGFRRMTLTPLAINRAVHVAWLITGTEKRPALKALRAHDKGIPASSVRSAADDLLVTDVAAAG